MAIDPTRRRSGGALLGDRIRMNSLSASQVFMRSLATRRQHLATSAVLADVIALYRAVGFDLMVVETAGIGQSDTEIVDVADISLYVMTAEYGAASQLEKIDMLDFADMIVLNKFEKRGAEDALRDVRKQWRRNHPRPVEAAGRGNSRCSRPSPAASTIRASIACSRRWALRSTGRTATPAAGPLRGTALANAPTEFRSRDPLVPSARVRYLAEIAAQGRDARHTADLRATAAQTAHGLYLSLEQLGDKSLPAPFSPAPDAAANDGLDAIRVAYNRALDRHRRRRPGSAAELAGTAPGHQHSRVFLHRAWPRAARR